MAHRGLACFQVFHSIYDLYKVHVLYVSYNCSKIRIEMILYLYLF